MIGSNIGRYQIIEEIGRGGMAKVFRAFDPRFKRDIAIKVMTRDLLEDPTLRARFEREAQTIAGLEHPAIVPVYDFGEDDNRPYLVMRLMTGGTLSDRLKHGPIGIGGTVKILQRIGSALERAHKNGIIHRDLKPSNIMFDDYGDAFLADFGIARLTESAITLTGDSVVGTPAYMSPEQIHGDKEIDGRSDIYALGIICFEMLTGRRPYEDKTPTKVMMKHIIDPVPDIHEVNPDLPEGVGEIINRSLAKEPSDRYTTASELTATLESLSREEVTDSLAAQEGSIVAAAVMGNLATADEIEVTEVGEVQSETEIAVAPSEDEYPDTEVITPAFPEEPAAEEDSGQEEPGHEKAYPETEVVAPAFISESESKVVAGGIDTGQEEAHLDTEVAAPVFAEAAIRQDGPAETEGASRGKKWLVLGIAGGIILILLIAAVIAGGFFLNSRDRGTEVIEEVTTPTVEAVSAGGPAQEATKTPRATPTINVRNRAEVQMQIFYRKVDEESYDEALETINQAIELVRGESWYYHERAWLYSLMGDYDAALNDLDHAIELSPADADYIGRRGATHLDFGNYDAAIEDLQLAIRRNRSNPYFHSDLGHALLAIDDIEGALAEFDEAVRLEPDNSGFLGPRADVYGMLGDYDAALRDLNRAIELSPNEGWHHEQMAVLLAWNFGEFEAALEHMDRAIELEPDIAWRYNEKASILREIGRIDEAIANHEEAIARDPEDIWNLLNLAITYRDFMGDVDAALVVYEEAANRAPDFADVYSERGHTYQYVIGDLDAALADYEHAAELDPEYSGRFNSLAVLYRDMGNLEASMANHERAISLDPEDGWAYMERGYTRRDLGQDVEGALTDFNQAIRLNPFSPDALLARALLYGWNLSEHDPAFADLERCHEVDPTFYWCFFDEAQLRDDVGDTDAAVANFERFLELVPEFDCPDCQQDAIDYIRQYG